MATRDLPQDHFCPWREEAERLQTQVDALSAEVSQLRSDAAQMRSDGVQMRSQLEALTRAVFGKKSEKMPPMAREVATPPSRASTTSKRADRAEAKEKLVTEEIQHKVEPKARTCPACSCEAKPAGSKDSIVLEWVPGYFRRQRHVRETLACSCGDYIVTADAPARVFDRSQYGAGFVAHLVVQKCADSIPLYRIEKQFERAGIPVSRSTMTDLFHRAGRLVEPLVKRVAAIVKASDLVLADETTHRMQSSDKRPYLWTFVAGKFVLYRFALDRSGATPEAVLGDSTGILLVDGYTGYNAVTTPERRERAGCLAHARRKFFDASTLSPDAATALEFIRAVYVIERQAADAHLAGTDAHLKMRESETSPIMEKFGVWLSDQSPRHLPQGPMGKAIRYALDNWTELTRFLEDPKIPPDNNRSEAALRVAALGRKNFLFVGHEEAGQNLANLYTLVGTCIAHGIEPTAYLADVLMRIPTHPAAQIDELLPHRWAPAV